MEAPHQNPAFRTLEGHPIVLEINGQGTEALRVPVVVRNLSTGVVILEVKLPGILTGEVNLQPGARKPRLALSAEGDEGRINIQGRLLWTRFVEENRAKVILGMELVNPNLKARQFLEDQISHTSKDLKGLWNRWDQAYNSEAPPDKKLYWVGMALLGGGMALQLTGSMSLKLFGWILWFLGSLAVAWKLKGLWQKRLHH